MSAQPKTAADVLRAARKLIEKPEAWCQRADARNAQSRKVSPRSDSAVCWCLIGAIRNPLGLSATDLIPDDCLWPLKAVVPVNIIDWNDDPRRTHAEILDTFDRAIALAERTRAAGGVG